MGGLYSKTLIELRYLVAAVDYWLYIVFLIYVIYHILSILVCLGEYFSIILDGNKK